MRGSLDLVHIPVAPVLADVAARYRARDMDVHVTGAAGSVRLPPDALDALLTSLLENAAMHAPGAQVSLSVEQDDGILRIVIADTGRGIPPEHRLHAFEPFYTKGRTAGGTGLGLPIVRAIAAGACGTVMILPNQPGTTVVVTLPDAGFELP